MRFSWMCERRVVKWFSFTTLYAMILLLFVLHSFSFLSSLKDDRRQPYGRILSTLVHKMTPKSGEILRKGMFKPPNCSVFDFLAQVDPSVSFYNKSMFCGPEARSQDVFCKMFFDQVGLREDGDCNRDTDDTSVPRFIYYVIFGHYEFHFWNYISFVAARRNFNFTALYVIGDAHPVGYWWRRVLLDVKGVRFIYRIRPLTIGNKTVVYTHHVSDIVRLQALLLNGGIFLDADMVITRPIDSLLQYDITMGLLDNLSGIGNAFISAKRNSDFIRDWYNHYNNFQSNNYLKNSLQIPWEMWTRDPTRLHMESTRLYRPNWYEADILFKHADYNWSENYAVHVWTNGNPVPKSEAEIQTLNTTIGQIFRYVMYGDPRPRTL